MPQPIQRPPHSIFWYHERNDTFDTLPTKKNCNHLLFFTSVFFPRYFSLPRCTPEPRQNISLIRQTISLHFFSLVDFPILIAFFNIVFCGIYVCCTFSPIVLIKMSSFMANEWTSTGTNHTTNQQQQKNRVSTPAASIFAIPSNFNIKVMGYGWRTNTHTTMKWTGEWKKQERRQREIARKRVCCSCPMISNCSFP